MAAGVGDDNEKSKRPESSKKDGEGHKIAPKDASPGQIYTLLDIVRDEYPKTVRVRHYESATHFILDVRAEKREDAQFIEYRLAKLVNSQDWLKTLHETASSTEAAHDLNLKPYRADDTL